VASGEIWYGIGPEVLQELIRIRHERLVLLSNLAVIDYLGWADRTRIQSVCDAEGVRFRSGPLLSIYRTLIY
jgi:hypothetical protein